VIGWVVLLFFANGLAGAIGDAYRQDFSLDGFESTDGFTLVESEFDDGSGSPQSGQIVFQAHRVNGKCRRRWRSSSRVARIPGVSRSRIHAGRRSSRCRPGRRRARSPTTVNLRGHRVHASEIARDLRLVRGGGRVELGGSSSPVQQPSAAVRSCQ
jgi:hypothetical protein